MKLIITIEVDGTDEYCEAVLTELETAVTENEFITITSGGGPCEVAILAVEEKAAVGRHRNVVAMHPDQLTIDDAISNAEREEE